ncbi:hypothetical protein KO481_16945 [Nocardia sp. NEAU-G5]|uniref:Uncharacterized protein n=1 Tax=Nocardia albiluteola TaxID=2842303 RepID=A0ABS6B1U9_9NOCA|nr:hypothetical protein [Nocardia albiluteola]MBU3063209.1 hypothetical protein [Nocardia albiluteola]
MTTTTTRGKWNGMCRTDNCPNNARWIPAAHKIRDTGEYYCEPCCQRIDDDPANWHTATPETQPVSSPTVDEPTDSAHDPGTLDITPDIDGLIRWARAVLAQEPQDSESARVARDVLRECGIEADTDPAAHRPGITPREQ